MTSPSDSTLRLTNTACAFLARHETLSRRWWSQSLSASLATPRSGELRTQKFKSHLVKTQSLKILPLKPGVGQYKAIHATLTARDFSLASFYPSGHSPAFFPNLSQFFPVLAVANTRSCVGPQNKIVTLLDAGSRVECPRNMNRLKKTQLVVWWFVKLIT